MNKGFLEQAIWQIDASKGIYVEFEVMSNGETSKRKADNYITGRGIISAFEDRIISVKVCKGE